MADSLLFRQSFLSVEERQQKARLTRRAQTGPTNSMVNSYVTASIQSAANSVGHIPGTNLPCARRGAIRCAVKLGGIEVDYLSYL